MSINNQFGFDDFIFFEKTQVSYTVFIFSASPEIIFLSLSFIHVMISLTKSTVTSKLSSIFLCVLIAADLIPIKVISAKFPLLSLSERASLIDHKLFYPAMVC